MTLPWRPHGRQGRYRLCRAVRAIRLVGTFRAVGTSAAEPARLLAFERTTAEELATLYGPAFSLAEKLEVVRSHPSAQRFLPDIPSLHNEVLDLYSVGRYLAGWVGDIGRAFLKYDSDGHGVVDDRVLENDVARLGDGAGAFTVIRVGGRIIIDTGDGDDVVTVTRAQDGRVIVMVRHPTGLEVPGLALWLTEAEATGLTIRVGSGNDTIEVATDVRVHFTMEGQSGDDNLRGGAGGETIRGGAGRDYVDGFSGDDVLDGGDGNDVIYAGDGNDLVSGGAGVDYLEGGRGDDLVLGGAHDDVISGGEGNDRIDGQAGNDALYTGHGDDRVTDLGGTNAIYAQTGDDSMDTMGNTNVVVNVDLSGMPGDSALRIVGSDRFQQRILEDLEMLRSSPNGRQMLLMIDDFDARTERSPSFFANWPIIGDHVDQGYEGNTIVIHEYPRDDDSFAAPGGDESPGAIVHSQGLVEMYHESYTRQPDQIAWQEIPPVVVLFHEMAHHYDFGNGTLLPGSHGEPSGPVPDAERQAVGLPVDHDGDPSTPDQIDPDHPIQFTENGLRREMGLPDRTTYGPP